MKKNYYLHLLAIMMVSMLSVVITSCGDDDENNNPTSPVTNPGNKLSVTQKKFLGYWHSNDGTTDFLFLGDGTCKSYSTDEEYINGYYAEKWNSKSGNWNYDETTKMLSTTIGGWQWTITLSTEQSWSGLSLNPNEAGAQSFSRSDMYHCCAYLRGYKWGAFSFEYSKYKIYFGRYDNYYESFNYYGEYIEYDNTSDFIYGGSKIRGGILLTDEIESDLKDYIITNNLYNYWEPVSYNEGTVRWSNFKYNN